MDLWVLSAAIAIGIQSGMAHLSERVTLLRQGGHFFVASLGVIIVANYLDHTRLPIWFLSSGVILVGLAGWRIHFRQRSVGSWGGTLEAGLAVLALWVVSADALAVVTGILVGILLAIALFPTWLTRRAWIHEWETLTLGAVGLQDIAHTVVGRLPTEHFNWLWMIPWLVVADFTATYADATALLPKRPKPPRRPPGNSGLSS